MTRQVDREAVRSRVVELLGEIAGIQAEDVSDTATIDNELQMQSVALVELQVALEDEYQLALDPIQIVELNAFGAIMEYIYETIEAS